MIRSDADQMHSNPAIPNGKPVPLPLSEEEREGRRKAVETARRSNQLSGFEPDLAAEALNARYIAGELTRDELTAATLALAGLPTSDYSPPDVAYRPPSRDGGCWVERTPQLCLRSSSGLTIV